MNDPQNCRCVLIPSSPTGLAEDELFFAPLLDDYMSSMYNDNPRGRFQTAMERAFICWRLAHTYREIEHDAEQYSMYAKEARYWYDAANKIRFVMMLPQSIDCPWCHAKAGENCTDPWGRVTINWCAQRRPS